MGMIASIDHQQWMSVLARAEGALLEQAWSELEPKPAYSFLRPLDTGMILLRGRIGGAGRPFNFGEATITRAAVALQSGEHGFAYLLGRRPRQAELAALFHALLQSPERRTFVEERVICPAEAVLRSMAAAKQAATASTRVDFATLVRGDG